MPLKDETSIRSASPQALEAMEFTRRRRALTWLNVALMVLFLLGTVVMVNLIALDHPKRLNWTADKLEELQPETLQRLKSIHRDIRVLVNEFDIAMYAADKSAPEAWRLIKEMLKEFERRNPRIKVTVLDDTQAQATPDWMRIFKAGLEPNTIYLYSMGEDGQENPRSFNVRELYIGEPQTGEIVDLTAETRLISAMWTMANSKRRIVYYTEGHEENRVEDPRHGMSLLIAVLRERDNVEFKKLNLAQDRQVPRDADAVFVAGPRSDFPREQLDGLKEYLEAGGRMIVSIEPTAPAKNTPDLRRFLEAWGARVTQGIVFDFGSNVRRQPAYVRSRAFGRHDINKDFASEDRFVDVPLTTQVRPQEPPDRKLAVASLLRSTDNAFLDVNGDTKPGSDEPRGPFDLAVAVEGEPVKAPRRPERLKPRLVVWGSTQVFTNANTAAGPDVALFNMHYYLNTFRWLLDLEQVIAPPPKPIKMRALDLRPGDRVQILVVSAVVLPMLGIVLGILAWWFRRK